MGSMTLELIVRSFAPNTRADRLPQDLRAYVRSEWQGDATWIRSDASRVPLRERFRAWLSSRRPTASPQPSPLRTSGSAVSTLPADAVEFVEPCSHPDAEELGLGGGAVFLRCLLCGDVLVVDSGQEWSLGSDASTKRADLLHA